MPKPWQRAVSKVARRTKEGLGLAFVFVMGHSLQVGMSCALARWTMTVTVGSDQHQINAWLFMQFIKICDGLFGVAAVWPQSTELEPARLYDCEG